MNTSPRIVTTDDGSATLYAPEVGEHYHSTKGAVTESEHIFIQSALAQTHACPIQLLEIGLGTGLNLLLTCRYARQHSLPIHYDTIERYPVSYPEVAALEYTHHTPELEEAYRTLHQSAWEIPLQLTAEVTCTKYRADIATFPYPSNHYDIVYYDAFSPEKQPHLWSEEVFSAIFRAMRPGGILTTYCAKGSVRRTLQAVGFSVERIPGPPGGKREILRASKQPTTQW